MHVVALRLYFHPYILSMCFPLTRTQATMPHSYDPQNSMVFFTATSSNIYNEITGLLYEGF